MDLTLFRRRQIWAPTWLGSLLLLLLCGVLPTVWWFQGEKFLSLTERQSAELLIVEGWIGVDGLRAAKAEFETGGYRYLVVASSQLNQRWGPKDWDVATQAHAVLLKAGMADEHIILSSTPSTNRQRTYESARAVRLTLAQKNLHSKTANIFTIGAHARRTRLVFAKALPEAPSVGVVSWNTHQDNAGRWWHSSDRAQEMIKETVGYFYELLLNSGRDFDSEPAIKTR